MGGVRSAAASIHEAESWTSPWAGPAIELAVAETRAFKSKLASTPETKTAA